MGANLKRVSVRPNKKVVHSTKSNVLVGNDDRSVVTSSESILAAINGQLMREIEERCRVEQALRYSQNEMRILSKQLLTAQEMERKNIAAELHDSIGQSLSAIKFCVERVVGSLSSRHTHKDTEQFDTVLSLIQDTMEEVRKIAMNLHPSTLTDLGIVPTIAWFCREFSSIYNHIRIEMFIDIEETILPLPLKTIIFRIVQEAFNNVVKHAKADVVSIRLHKAGPSIELIVQDNGIGLDLESIAVQGSGRKWGFGITGMRERAEFSGGAFCIKPAPDCGTMVCVSWPLQH